jgi:hypothetical protein
MVGGYVIDIQKIYPLVTRALIYKTLDVLKCEVVLLDFNLSREAGPFKEAAISHAKEAQRVHERVFELTKFNLALWIEGHSFHEIQSFHNTIMQLLKCLKDDILEKLAEASTADEKTAAAAIKEIRKSCEKLISDALETLSHMQESIDAFIESFFSHSH